MNLQQARNAHKFYTLESGDIIQEGDLVYTRGAYTNALTPWTFVPEGFIGTAYNPLELPTIRRPLTEEAVDFHLTEPTFEEETRSEAIVNIPNTPHPEADIFNQQQRELELAGLSTYLVIVYHKDQDDKVFQGHHNDEQKLKKQARNHIRRVLKSSIKNAQRTDEERHNGLTTYHVHMS